MDPDVMEPQPFSQPLNVAVITTRGIISGRDWIAWVFHDAEDGGWQFLSRDRRSVADAAVVSLSSVLELDQSVLELADLPLGGHAWRETKDSQWRRAVD